MGYGCHCAPSGGATAAVLIFLSFLAVILIVVSVHEYGHYVAARCLGVRVLRFSVGFGKPLFMRRDSHGTEWAIAPILLGGYVRMLDADALHGTNLPREESIEAQSHWRRIVIYAAGPFANLLLSFVIILLLLTGGEQGLRPLVDSVRAQSPAANAGMAAGQEITRINGEEIVLWRQADIAMVDAVLEGGEVAVEMDNGSRYVIPAGEAQFADMLEHGGAAAALGVYPFQRYIKLTVSTVQPESPAAQAGIRPGDALVQMDGVLLEHWRDAVAVIERSAGRSVPIIVWRDRAALTLTATPQQVKSERREKGYLGVSPQVDAALVQPLLTTLAYSPLQLPAKAVQRTFADVQRTFSFLGLVFSAHVPREQISGPIGIAVQSGEAATLGIAVWLRFITLISTSLGILNLLPLPLLDGGQIVLNVIQWACRRDFADSVLRVWQGFGAAVILLLMVFVIINDILQLF